VADVDNLQGSVHRGETNPFAALLEQVMDFLALWNSSSLSRRAATAARCFVERTAPVPAIAIKPPVVGLPDPRSRRSQ
jgi:hypothetical protein